MTQEYFAAIIGTIYISHATNKEFNGIIGCLILIAVSVKNLGWI